MNPTRSMSSRRNDESRSILSEGHNAQLKVRSRTEEEKQRRREEWKHEQEMRRQHERLKRKKIEEYEKERALKQALKMKGTSLHRCRSRSGSKSPTSYHLHRRRSLSSISKSDIIFERSDESTSGAVPLFKGPEGTQISPTELRRIKVDIRRNIPVKEPVTELQRDILNPEDVVLKRREEERSAISCTPNFSIVQWDYQNCIV